MDDVDRSLYATFSTAANSLSQLYTQSMNQQKTSFQAGERHGLEKLYQWIFTQKEGGDTIDVIDILNYLQNELDYHGAEPIKAAAAPPNQQTSQSVRSSGAPAGAAQGFRPQDGDYVFSHALSSPVRRILQNFSQGGFANH